MSLANPAPLDVRSRLFPAMKLPDFSLRQALALLLIGQAMLVGAACHHRSIPAKPDSGTSSFRFVIPAPASAQATVMSLDEPFSTERFKDAEAILPLTMPVYPARALAAKAGLVNIGVKISIDADGRVTDVSPSLLTFSTPSRYAAAFEEAVRLAVMTWHFHPAEHYYFEVSPDENGVAKAKFLRKENTETSFDIAFTFTATGSVLAGESRK